MPKGGSGGLRREAYLETHVGIWEPAPAVRRGLVSVLAGTDFSPEEPVDLVTWVRRPGRRAVLVSIDIPNVEAVVASVREARPETRIVGLLPDDAADTFVRALRFGCGSAVPKDASPEEIVEVLHAVLRGFTVLPSEVAVEIAKQVRLPDKRLDITDEESDWLARLARGQRVSDMAPELGYSRRSMHRHLKMLYVRLGVRNRSEAVSQVARIGSIARPEPSGPRSSD